jgi:hypothetical protein
MMGRPLPDLHPIEGISGRLWDITKPLLQICLVVCPERYDALVNAFLDIASARTQEKRESFDGLLVSVIFEKTKGDADHFDILTSDVTTRFSELWNGDKPKSPEWTGRRLKAIGIKTDRKNQVSMIRLDRLSRNTLLAQYGFPEDEITSTSSITSKDAENIDVQPLEDLFEDLSTKKNRERSSKSVHAINLGSCEDVKDVEDMPGVFAKVAAKKNLREVRI